MIGKSNWVCGNCGQGFTRKYSATRHIGNLHFGNASIFRPFEYIVARINGHLSPSDPLLFRTKKTNRTRTIKSIRQPGKQQSRISLPKAVAVV
jgi:hypothetical protein